MTRDRKLGPALTHTAATCRALRRPGTPSILAMLVCLASASCDGGNAADSGQPEGGADGGRDVATDPSNDAGPDVASDADIAPVDGAPEGGADGDAASDAADADEESTSDAAPDVDSSVDGDVGPDAETSGLCSNLCLAARDGSCDDGGEGSRPRLCEYGTDCADCGPRDPDGCEPDCAARHCGSDGCGSSCGAGCDDGATCSPGGQCVEWVTVTAGEWFEMGSPGAEEGRFSLELSHDVFLTRDFAMATLEVTNEWAETLLPGETSDDDGCGPSCPVDGVTWHEAVRFCNVLSSAEGLARCYDCVADDGGDLACALAADLESPYDCDGYRLPTEAEWELAARGGTVTATHNGDLTSGLLDCESPNAILDPIAWFCGNTATRQPVGLLAPNDFGLYDMLGNVQEWVHDWYWPYSEDALVDPFGPPSASHRAARGCCYYYPARGERAAHREGGVPDGRNLGWGFRPARTLFE